MVPRLLMMKIYWLFLIECVDPVIAVHVTRMSRQKWKTEAALQHLTYKITVPIIVAPS